MTVDTRLKRLPERGSEDFDLACAIIDAARICHVGITLQKQPYVIPMALGRDGRMLLLHGSVVSRLVKNLVEGLPCCVTVTHLDGLVLARSAFHSSMNYRSVMVFGKARLIDDPASDLSAPVWAGVVPLELKSGKPLAAPDMQEKHPFPDYLKQDLGS